MLFSLSPAALTEFIQEMTVINNAYRNRADEDGARRLSSALAGAEAHSRKRKPNETPSTIQLSKRPKISTTPPNRVYFQWAGASAARSEVEDRLDIVENGGYLDFDPTRAAAHGEWVYTGFFGKKKLGLSIYKVSIEPGVHSVANSSNMNIPRPQFQALGFIPVGEREKTMSYSVESVLAVAHEELSGGGNHWCFYLQIPGGQHSVHIDITPSYTVPSTTLSGGSKAYMLVSHLEYQYLQSATKVVQLDVRAGLAVRDFVDLPVENGRHQYEFNSEGQGCRYWTDEQIDLFFFSRGFFVTRAQVTEAKNAILTQHPSGLQYPLVVGAYWR
ncbi:hypothetical protein BJY04DRAFT_220718 [Aspergillus karnatakaensis]|uniref:uncharacterized protein n=1 Tax=Aspergillus karnatakaensis TaxID=1810916 RepID=UPI003CCDA53B